MKFVRMNKPTELLIKWSIIYTLVLGFSMYIIFCIMIFLFDIPVN